MYDEIDINFFDHLGTVIITHPMPPKGTKYIGNGKARGFMADPEAALQTRKNNTLQRQQQKTSKQNRSLRGLPNNRHAVPTGEYRSDTTVEHKTGQHNRAGVHSWESSNVAPSPVIAP